MVCVYRCNLCFNFFSTKSYTSLVPRPSPAPIFDHLQYAKTEGEGLVNLTTWSVAQALHVVTLIRYGEGPILRSVLATKTRQAPTENNIKRRKHIRGIAPKGCRMTCVKYLQWQNLANIAKKQPLLDLKCLQRNHPSAVLLQTLEAGLVFRLEVVWFL